MLRKYRLLRDSGLIVFDRRSAANILSLRYASTNPVLDRLVKKKVLVRLRRDRYVLPEQITEQSRKIANELIKPSCISLWTALSDAGFVTQMPREVQSVTTKRSAIIERDGLPTFSYMHLPDQLFFAVTIDKERILRAGPEKALLDIIYIQRGNFDWESATADKFDRVLLRKYCRRFPQWVKNALPPSLSLP